MMNGEALRCIRGASLGETYTTVSSLLPLYITKIEGERAFPDPEDDRILIWEVLPTGHKKVVWYFSGWHWGIAEFWDLDEGQLPSDSDSLYTIANSYNLY